MVSLGSDLVEDGHRGVPGNLNIVDEPDMPDCMVASLTVLDTGTWRNGRREVGP